MTANIESSDIIEGTLTVGSSGEQHARSFIVKDLDGPAHGRHKQALDAVGITRGQLHPDTRLTLLPAASATVEMMAKDNTIAKVTWTYKVEGDSSVPPTGDQAQIEVGSTVQSVQSHKDADGNVITVSYVPLPDPETGEPAAIITQGGIITVQVPLTTLTFTRRELPTWNGTTIGKRSQQFTGRVNSVDWEGGATRTWLCTGIVGNSTDGGATYTVRYSFVYNRDTWQARVVFQDASGNVPTDIGDARHNGQADKLVVAYKTIPFAVLSLTNP